MNVVMNPTATPITKAKSDASAIVMIAALSMPVFTAVPS